ncbi:MAG: ATP-binding cassette domain-containing protein, partial [Janthinobacterium sp.]
GNYDEYMFASTQARNQQLANNAKAKDKVAELQEFVRRFAANKSKARQATSRAKQIEKIKVDDIKPSSRAYPFVRFDGEKKLHRLAVEVENISKGFDRQLFKNFSIMVEAGERIAIIGANGAGKTTMLRCIAGDIAGLQPDQGRVKWAENANVGYMPQDPTEDFAKDTNLTDWIGQWTKEGDDDQAVRSILGRLLFGGDDVKKAVKVLSGGEKGRMMYGKLMLGRHNVLMLDEPTNHLDMESIESLNIALEKYAGTLIFVSHDREFVSSLANRIIEIKEDEVVDYRGNYEDYLKSQGID